MWHVGLWERSASSSHGMNASASKCVLLILRSTTDLNACGFEGCPARVTNSISPLSYRTLRPWRSVPSGHPMRPSSRREPEYPRFDQATTNSQNRLQVSPPSAIQAITNKNGDFFDSIGHWLRFWPVRAMSGHGAKSEVPHCRNQYPRDTHCG